MPSYVPGLEPDIFISYSHLDNLASDGRGWVSALATELRYMVGQRVGEEVSLWRDDRIGPATVFAKELEEHLRNAAVLVSVISPGYAKSGWCQWELSGFVGDVRTGDLV